MTTPEAALAITTVVGTMFHGVDTLDWDAVRATLAPRLANDYTALWGGEPVSVTADELVEAWGQLVPGFDATQHLLGPIVVTDDGEGRATCVTNVRASHYVRTAEGATATWLVVGRYDIAVARLDGGWRIAGVTLRVFDEEGGRHLVDTARERCAARSGGRAT